MSEPVYDWTGVFEDDPDDGELIRLPASVLSLGMEVVAEHPDGHRVVGKVIGCGTSGVILHAEPLRSPYLSYDRGWVVRTRSQTSTAVDVAPSDSERRSTAQCLSEQP